MNNLDAAILLAAAAAAVGYGFRVFGSRGLGGSGAWMGRFVSTFSGLPFTLKGVFTVVLILVGGGIFYWKLYTPGLRFAQVGDWAWEHWLWLLVFGAIVCALIKLNETALGTMAGTLQTTLAGAMFAMFLLIPAGIWVKDFFLPQIICKDVSAYETRSCELNTAWSSLVKFAEGPENNGMRLCLSPGVLFERSDSKGTTFWRFKAPEGRLVASYRLIPGTEKCPAKLP